MYTDNFEGIWNPYLVDLYAIDMDKGSIVTIPGVSKNTGDINTIDGYRAREYLVDKYSWAIPNRTAVELVRSVGMPILEVGAGKGYWSEVLRRAGIDVLATDIEPSSTLPMGLGRKPGYWSNVKGADSVTAVRKYGKGRVLMSVWPPYMSPMIANALKASMQQGGDTLIYVGEGDYGATGDDSFFELLHNHFVLQSNESIPRYEGIHDSIHIYRRIA